MKLSKPKKTSVEKQELIIKKCKNKNTTEQFIHQYQQSAKGAIKQILNMGIAVKEMNERYKLGELNIYDLNYFCMTVGINQKSSTFRKYKAIGKNTDKFRVCMDRLPTAFSVLYELATLEADLFEKIVINGEYGKNLTLKQVRKLANKRNTLPSKNVPMINTPIYIPPNQIAKAIKKINRFVIYISSSAKESELNEFVKLLDNYQKNGALRYEMPEITDYLDNDDGEQLKLAA